MKLLLVCVGKLRSEPLRVLCEEYLHRLQRYGACEIIEVAPAKAKQPPAAQHEESARVLQLLAPADRVWVLDERGRAVSSVGLASNLKNLENQSVKRLVLLLGGAYGFDEVVRRRGEAVSLSPLTFPHELCRLILLEQLYRARTIQRGEPYHH